MRIKKPLAFVTNLDLEHISDVSKFLKRFKIPTFIDPFNHKDTKKSLAELAVWEDEIKRTDFKSILKFGHTPTSRVWRKLARNWSNKFYFYNYRPYIHTGLPFKFKTLSLNMSVDTIQYRFVTTRRTFDFPSKSEHSFLQAILKKYRHFDFFVGNSLPAYTFLYLDHLNVSIWGNRGCNGIDGLVSTFAGFAYAKRNIVGIIGDLSLLYDITGLLMLKNAKSSWRLFVINNKGGKIFDFFGLSKNLPNKTRNIMRAKHNVNLEGVVTALGLKFYSISSESQLKNIPERGVIEIIPDNRATVLAWRSLLKS
ncbi:MAG: hypothetical protein N2654_03875 [Deltaproteobacteria bacterium]|nr:hypothetical protein [Deltaproteobacteria bacterium]